MKELDEELTRLREKAADKKSLEAKMLKEQNMRVDDYERQMERLLADKKREWKERETSELASIKHDYEIRVKAFRDKYKQLEDGEFKHLDGEHVKAVDAMRVSYEKKRKEAEAEHALATEQLNRQV